MLEAVAVGLGIYTAWEDFKEKSITLIFPLLLSVVATYLNFKTDPTRTTFALVLALGIGLAMRALNVWQEGDTLLLIMYSAVNLKPIWIWAGAIGTSFATALATRGREERLPFAPFLLIGFILSEVVL